MRHLVLLLLLVTIQFGCVKSNVHVSLEKIKCEDAVRGITILADEPEDYHFAECIQERLEDDLENVFFVQDDKFRDSLFPWFESKTKPKSENELGAILSKTMVKDRINTLGVDLLIYVNGYTFNREEYGWGGGHGAAVFFGGSSRHSSISISIWNLNNADHLGDLEADSKGTAHYGLLGVFPYLIPARTESACCREIATLFSNWLIENNYLEGK
jgi:hypothetical protein